MTPFRLSRRALLRGTVRSSLGVALGLPLLDAMLNSHGTALAAGDPLPLRFGVFFWGNGSDPARWAPAATGADWQPSEMLQGIAAVKDYVNIVSGTRLAVRGAHNPHVEGAVAILAGGNPVLHPSFSGQSNDWDYLTVPGPSVDQIAADHLAGPTRFRSIVASATPVHTGAAGTSSAPGTAISYTSHSAPFVFNSPKTTPSELFGYLFGTPVGTPPSGPDPEMLVRADALGAVLADANALRRRLGTNDRQRLEQHMDSVRELQARILAMPPPVVGACAQPTMPTDPASLRLKVKVFADLIAMGFACDLTRVFSLQFSSPASHVAYPDLFPSYVYNGTATSFHEYEHNAGIDETVRTTLKYFVEIFGSVLESFRALPERGGNLLDRSCILGTSELSFGPSHGFDDFPILLAGKAGGALKYPGVHVTAPGENAARVPFTALKAIGAPLASWGRDQLLTSAPVAELLT